MNNNLKRVRLDRLEFKNFKGIKNLGLKDLDEGSTLIYGNNATGKTTIFDGFCWLLFGKDSLNSAAFEIKTLNEDGETLHGLEHEVSALLNVDGIVIELRKVYAEKYTKRRGEAKAVFTGHTIDHFVNGVPNRKGEFDSVVAEICDETAFKMLTNPRYFNETLHWTDRRKTLLEMCGDVSDADVIASDPKLAELPAILGKHSLADYRKIAAARLVEINIQLSKIPVRIDEIENSRIEVARTMEQITQEIKSVKAKIKEKKQELADLEAGGGTAALRKRLAEVETKILENKNAAAKVKAAIDRELAKELAKLEARVDETANEIKKAIGIRDNLVVEQKQIIKEAKQLEAQMIELRNKWHSVNETQFVPRERKNICLMCGQQIPVDQIQEAFDKALADFNEQKAAKLAKIVEDGTALKAERDKFAEKFEANDELLSTWGEKITTLNLANEKAIADRDAELNATDEPNISCQDDEALYVEKETILDKLGDIKSNLAQTAEQYQNEIQAEELVLEDLNREVMQHEANARIIERVNTLKIDERALAAEFEKIEHEKFLMELFIKNKVELLEGPINARFELARFQLFSVNINGGIEECCNTTYQGVPYNSMNNGARINIGLDICNALSEYYGVCMPVFIDNAEAVTSLTRTNSQQIKLIVSATDQKLRIEKEKE